MFCFRNLILWLLSQECQTSNCLFSSHWSYKNAFIFRNQKKHRCVHLDDAKPFSTEEYCCRLSFYQSLLINGRFLIQIFCIQSILLFPRYNLNLWQYFKFADPSTYQDIPSPLLTDVPFPINPFLLTPSFLLSFHHFRHPRNSFARPPFLWSHGPAPPLAERAKDEC